MNKWLVLCHLTPCKTIASSISIPMRSTRSTSSLKQYRSLKSLQRSLRSRIRGRARNLKVRPVSLSKETCLCSSRATLQALWLMEIGIHSSSQSSTATRRRVMSRLLRFARTRAVLSIWVYALAASRNPCHRLSTSSRIWCKSQMALRNQFSPSSNRRGIKLKKLKSDSEDWLGRNALTKSVANSSSLRKTKVSQIILNGY